MIALSARVADNRIYGADSNDSLYGGEGNDFLASYGSYEGGFSEISDNYLDANLKYAYLDVNLGRANLEGANLEGADLKGGNLVGANLKGAIMPDEPSMNRHREE